MREAVIVAAARTPIGRFQGALQSFAAPRLGAIAVREAIRRAGIRAEEVDECIMGASSRPGWGRTRRGRPRFTEACRRSRRR